MKIFVLIFFVCCLFSPICFSQEKIERQDVRNLSMREYIHLETMTSFLLKEYRAKIKKISKKSYLEFEYCFGRINKEYKREFFNLTKSYLKKKSTLQFLLCICFG